MGRHLATGAARDEYGGGEGLTRQHAARLHCQRRQAALGQWARWRGGLAKGKGMVRIYWQDKLPSPACARNGALGRWTPQPRAGARHDVCLPPWPNK